MIKNIKILVTLLISCLFTMQLSAQKETNWWFFGQNVGLNFNNLQTRTASDGSSVTNLPTVANGPISTIEGCFSISDKDGNFLMASDGSTVYNKNQNVMNNGTGLLGNSSSSQSGITFPVPGSTSKFYIISVNDAASLTGVHYSVVDLSLNGGLGSVLTKNQTLLSGQTSENIMAIPNSSDDTYWLIHRDNKKFYVWKATSTSISLVHTLSYTATSSTTAHATWERVGYLTASSDYKKITAAALGHYNMVADFNPATGVISNIIIRYNLPVIYKMEFSKDSKWLIMACNYDGNGLYAIKYSDFISGAPHSRIYNERISCIQRHTDGRMYGTAYLGDRSLFVIMDPDNGGTSVKKITNFFPRDPQWGLPNFPAGFFTGKAEDKAFVCRGNNFRYSIEVNFTGPIVNYPVKLIWNWGDGTANETQNITSNTQTKYTLTHNYAAPGTYNVTVTPYKAGNIALSQIPLEAKVVDCKLQVNRMIRINVDNKSTQLVKQ